MTCPLGHFTLVAMITGQTLIHLRRPFPALWDAFLGLLSHYVTGSFFLFVLLDWEEYFEEILFIFVYPMPSRPDTIVGL